MTDKEFIKDIITDANVDEETSTFLLQYLSAWMSNTGIDINAKTIKQLNENKELIDRLKILYSKEKIIDTIERKIILSDIAKGQVSYEQGRVTKLGIEYVTVEPSFGERISAINALNALDAIDDGSGIDKVLIVDDITADNKDYERSEELLDELDQ